MLRSFILLFVSAGFLLASVLPAEAATTTIPYGQRNSYGEVYTIPNTDFIIESGGCFHSIPGKTTEENVNRYIKNNFQIAGPGFYISDSKIQETSGAIRVCSGVTDSALHVNTWFGGTITLSADATIGIVQLDAVKEVYVTKLAATETAAETARLTLRAADSSDTFFIAANNDSFTNPITLTGNGKTQIGKISTTSLKVYDQDSNASTRLSPQTFSFDGSVGSLGSGEITIEGSTGLTFERTGNVTVANTIKGSGNLAFKGDAVYTFSANNALTGMTNTGSKPIEVGADATVKLVWASKKQSTSDQKFTGSGTIIAAYNDDFTAIENYSSFVGFSNFTGRLLLANGYRWNPGLNFNASYSLGAVEGGQMFLANVGNYNLTLYIEGMGKQGIESFGAIRMTGQFDGSKMTNLGGTVYLTGDARVSAGNVPTTPDKTYNLGMISAAIHSEDATNKAPLRICGLAYANAYTQMVLTSSENDYGKTYIEGQAILQLGYIGTVNGKNFDGTTGELGSGDVVFVAVDGTTATTSDLKGKVLFARSNDYEIENAFQGNGTLEFTGGGNYSLTATDALKNFTGKITVAEGTTFDLTGQTVPAEVNLEMNGALQADLFGASESEPVMTFSGASPLKNGSTLKFTNEEGYGTGDWVAVAKAASFEGLDLKTLKLDAELPWILSVKNEGGAAYLMAQVQLPEPSSIALVLVGIAGIFVLRGKNKK